MALPENHPRDGANLSPVHSVVSPTSGMQIDESESTIVKIGHPQRLVRLRGPQIRPYIWVDRLNQFRINSQALIPKHFGQVWNKP